MLSYLTRNKRLYDVYNIIYNLYCKERTPKKSDNFVIKIVHVKKRNLDVDACPKEPQVADL